MIDPLSWSDRMVILDVKRDRAFRIACAEAEGNPLVPQSRVAERDAEITRLRAELAEARVGEERYQCLLHNVGLINDLAKSWNPVTNGKLIDYLNLKVAAIVARTTKSSV